MLWRWARYSAAAIGTMTASVEMANAIVVAIRFCMPIPAVLPRPGALPLRWIMHHWWPQRTGQVVGARRQRVHDEPGAPTAPTAWSIRGRARVGREVGSVAELDEQGRALQPHVQAVGIDIAAVIELDLQVTVLGTEAEVLRWVPLDTQVDIVDMAVKTAAVLLHAGGVGIHPPLVIEGVSPAQLQRRRPRMGIAAGRRVADRNAIHRCAPADARARPVPGTAEAQPECIVALAEPPAIGGTAEIEIQLAVHQRVGVVMAARVAETFVQHIAVSTVHAEIVERETLAVANQEIHPHARHHLALPEAQVVFQVGMIAKFVAVRAADLRNLGAQPKPRDPTRSGRPWQPGCVDRGSRHGRAGAHGLY